MATRVAFIQRQDRARRIRRVRLVGMQTAEVWTPAEDALDAADQLNGAADWIDKRLGASAEGPSLTAVVVDAEGAVIDWLTAPSADQQVVQAALARAAAGAPADDEFDEFGATAAGRFGRDATVADASIQAAGHPAGGNGVPGRLGAMTIPDADIRLLIDRLDARGRSAGRILSIWHALSCAWDPALADADDDADTRVAATDAPVTACILIDPDGALIWSWARAGRLITGGRMRLASAEASAVAVRPADLGRLASDWLSWSAQLGQAPARIICVCPPLAEASGSLTPAQIGETLGAAWPGATVDMAVPDDPVEATLDRLVRQADLGRLPDAGDPGAALVSLSARPGRAHRAAYLSICAAALAMAALLGVVGFRQWQAAGAFEQTRRQVIDETRALAQSVDPGITRDFRYLLTQRIEELTGGPPTERTRQPRPILEELDAISLFIGEHGPKITLSEIVLSSAAVTVKFTAPDTETAEAVEATADTVAVNVRYLGSRQGTTVSLIGTWLSDRGDE